MGDEKIDSESGPTASPRSGRIWASPVADCARQTLKDAMIRAGIDDPKLILKWREIAGERLARLTLPVRITKPGKGAGGTLILKAAPSAALELQHESPALVSRINAVLGKSAIDRIKVEYGTIETQRLKPPPRPLKAEEQAQIAATTSKIQDRGLKQALNSLGAAILRTPR